ncbi:MAG: hypothetical protein ACLUZ8_12030 [Gemmiger formicilis]|uniref:hypothetical protein n=1 Tax=Gemmiger formicilis TaxID=745368 RepID=UPI003999B8E8
MKPEDFEAIRQNDTEFVTSEEFSKIKWIVNEHEDIKDQAPKEYMAQVKEQCTGVNAVCGGIDSFFMATIVAAPVPNHWRWNAVRTY